MSVSYEAILTNPQLSFVVDGPNDLIYMSAATLTSGATTPEVYKKYIRRFDLDLVPDDSVMFAYTCDTGATI